MKAVKSSAAESTSPVYKSWWSSTKKKGYSAVCIYSLSEPLEVAEKLDVPCFDREGRVLTVCYGGFTLVNAYFPKGQRDHPRVPSRLSPRPPTPQAVPDEEQRSTMREQVIIYDGECRFCLWSVGRIERLDRRRQFEYLPRQSAEVEERFPFLADGDFNTGLRLVVNRENVYVGADSVYQIYRRIPPFHLVAWLYRVPILHRFVKACYAIIARNRHRFGKVECDTGTCAPSKTASRT